MTDTLSEFVITEGRAYHRGDVVILRMRENVRPESWERVHMMLRDLREKTGVEFVLISSDVEVVEPEP